MLDYMNREESHYTVKEFAALARFSPWTIREWIKDGRLQAAKVRNEFRIPAEEIRRLGFSVPGS